MKSLIKTILLFLIGAFVCVAKGQSVESRKEKEGIVRHKFFFSIGGGPAVINTNSEISSPYYPQGITSSTVDAAFATTFRLGWAVSPSWIIYYENKVCLTNTYTLENDLTSRTKGLFGY